jgi:hypothetical protein
MTITVDKDKALELLTRAVEEKGAAHVYPMTPGEGCKYVVDGQPACIVGHVLYYLDESILPEIENWERNHISDPNDWEYYADEDGFHQSEIGLDGFLDDPGFDNLHDALLKGNRIVFTPEAVAVLSRAQRIQDEYQPWGDALREARSVVGQ